MGLSQAEMARRMGVSVATIQKWESGKSRRDTFVESREFDDFAELVTREDVSNLFCGFREYLTD
jgi:transcriptional regulator with XRE-family HTH domain